MDTAKQLPTIETLTERARAKALARQQRKAGFSSWIMVAVFLALHLPLAVAMKQVTAIAIAHAATTVVIGLWFALNARQHVERVAYICAYTIGAEVLWRMTGAAKTLPWETGKYGMAVFCLVALARLGRFRIPTPALIYFLLLLPSGMLTLGHYELPLARQHLAYNLSGPLALMSAVAFFSQFRMKPDQLFRLLVSLIGPILGVAAICYNATLGSDDLDIHFGRGSNQSASGGFGPNQVSATMGLGMLASFLCIVDGKVKLPLKIILFGGVALLIAQTMLTFSRTGLYLAVATSSLAALYLVRNGQTRLNLLMCAVVVVLLANYVLIPKLDEFTGGALSRRLQDTDPTSRDEILKSDLLIWQENFVLGVGPGLGAVAREKFMRRHGSHTEYSRLLAEHGVLGFGSLIMLGVMAVQSLRRPRLMRGKALTLAMLGFALLFMLVSGMRLAIPAFGLGVSFATLLPEDEPSRDERSEPRPAPAT